MTSVRSITNLLRHGRDARDPEGGYVLVTMALMATLLMLFAGYSVDAGNWNVQRNKTQTAAEAAALGGVAFLPDDYTTAQLTAERIAMNHGYDAGEILVEPGSGDNQLKVTITDDVSNYFLRIVGQDSTTIARSAVAEFEQPVEMGSPEHILGNDPETGFLPDYWLSIAARNVRKDLGDRFATRRCYAGAGNCNGTWNMEYDSSGYKYAVEVTDTTVPLRIQIFDPGWTWTGSTCNIPNWPTPAEIADLQTFDDGSYTYIPVGYYDDAATRFAGGDTEWCTGDDRPGNNGTSTRFSVHLPDTSPWNDNDNQQIWTSTCQPRTFGGFEPTSIYAPPTQSIFEYLSPVHGADNHWQVRNNNFLSFAETFRRWFTICEISPGPWLREGTYIVKVRTTTSSGTAQNRFSLRAGPPSGSGVADVGQATFSRGRLPIYANTSAADIEFFLARVPPSSGERVLKVSFWDVGDAAAPGTLSVNPPPGSISLGYFPNCDFELGGIPFDPGTVNCSVPNVLDTNGYGENLVEVTVTVPSQNDPDPNRAYWCDVTDPDDCWVTVRAQFPGGITDSTTWTAELIGDAVRLVDP